MATANVGDGLSVLLCVILILNMYLPELVIMAFAVKVVLLNKYQTTLDIYTGVNGILMLVYNGDGCHSNT